MKGIEIKNFRSNKSEFADALSRPLISRILWCTLALNVAYSALQFALWEYGSPTGRMLDFHALYSAGQFALNGDFADAYNLSKFMQSLRTLFGAVSVYLWSYPPQFGLIVAVLALLPTWLAYAVWSGGGLAALRLGVAQLQPDDRNVAVWLIFIPALLCLRGGQTSIWFAVLGIVALSNWKNKPWKAGMALGLMAFKPHLVGGLLLLAILRGEKSIVASFGLTLAAVSAAATVIFGADVWSAFLEGTNLAGKFLGEGYYPLYRMFSVYATFRSIGVSPDVALYIQIAMALVALFTILWTSRHGRSLPEMQATAILAGLMMTPYAFDYDLSIAVLALLLVAPALARLDWRRYVFLTSLWWFPPAYSCAILFGMQFGGAEQDQSHWLSLGAPFVLAASFFSIWFARLETGKSEQR